MTPFEEAGYTKETKFKVLVDYGDLREGDIVTIYEDDGSDCPEFKTVTGIRADMFVPNCRPGKEEDLEVYEEPSTSLQQRVTELEKVIEQLKEKGIV